MFDFTAFEAITLPVRMPITDDNGQPSVLDLHLRAPSLTLNDRIIREYGNTQVSRDESIKILSSLLCDILSRNTEGITVKQEDVMDLDSVAIRSFFADYIQWTQTVKLEKN